MRPVIIIFLLAILVTMMPLGNGLPDDQSPEAVEKWFQKLPQAKHQLTKLHFYLHLKFTSDPPVSIPVARANTTAKSPTLFGQVNALDGPLTEQPDSSETIGYSQGLYSSTSQEEISLLVTMSYVFVAGEYNGSTLSVLGRNPVREKYREIPIVGGSGDFRLARGFCTYSTLSEIANPKDEIIEITCFFHRYVISGGD
ncbi:OLC1v1013807C1 [Oldenlandia corymbosa var. corymbosa]|uniref:Dirigent protein n=1 Tax=Oldenlandia corymbosa var. corymbosa TaxID=529605 RepID=A0AAV1E2M3_OLDCO|nr:OLC1v1013807C1 [Oldenlandia corymbosa var. corymbosa]